MDPFESYFQYASSIHGYNRYASQQNFVNLRCARTRNQTIAKKMKADLNNKMIIIYSIYRALIPNGPKALYIIKITKS